MKLRNNIFVSSTFQDMHAERDMLHRVVVPELASRFAKRHVTVDLIDLRWGIDTSEESSEQENTVKILKVCFDEIERSRPFFIGFIGERYGWVPNVTDIESATLGYGFDTGGREMSITEMEMLYALQSFESPENCLFFIRNGLSPEDIEDEALRGVYFPTDPALTSRADRLKAYLREAFPASTHDYFCRWDAESRSVVGLEDLCEMVTEGLSALIEAELGCEKNESSSPLGEERMLMTSILEDTLERTFGREEEISLLMDFALGEGEESELILSAPSGVGKSSVMAGFAARCRDRALVIPFLAGVSERTTDFRFLARYMLSSLTGSDDDAILTLPYGEIKKRLLSALADAAEVRRVVLVVDALDQFAPSHELSMLDWISEQLLPKNVRVVYSALPEHCDAAIRRGARLLSLTRLATEDIKRVASGIAARLHKELSPRVLELLADKHNAEGECVCSSPIYLVLLLELLCSFDSDDFAEINRTGSREGLSPAAAIQYYLEQTILGTGTDTADVLSAISRKSILALGEKYHLITSLLTASPEGMSERDIIGITALTDTPVTVADFSLYRRMLRMHLVERDGGAWVFNHAIIRTSLGAECEARDNTALFTSAAEYYLSLPERDGERASRAVGFLGRLARYKDLVRVALSNGEHSAGELCSLLTSPIREDILDAAGESIFELFRPIYALLSLSLNRDTRSVMLLCTSVIRRMLALDWQTAERTELLSDVYFLLGRLLMEQSDAGSASFLEISANLLARRGLARQAALRALEISGMHSSREEWWNAESYAVLAYRQASRLRGDDADGKFLAEVTYTLAECIRSNPLSLRAPLRAGYLARALELARLSGCTDLGARCALEYLSISRILCRPTVRAAAEEYVRQTDESELSGGSRILRELYLAESGDAILHTGRAYQAAVMTLAESGDTASTLLFARTAEAYLYRIMTDAPEQYDLALELLGRADRAMKKLALITGDITYTDRRLLLREDFRRYAASRGKEHSQGDCDTEIEKEITRERARRGGRAARKKDVYTSLGVRLGAVGFLAYAAVQLADVTFSSHASVITRQLSLILRNVSEAFVNILVSVMLFFGLLMIYAYEKRSYDYRTDNARFVALGVAASVLLAVSAASDLCHVSLYVDPSELAVRFHGTTWALIMSVIFSATVTYFIAYAVNLAVSRPYSGGMTARFRYRYRGGELILRHVKLLAIAAIPAVAFLPLYFYQPRYGADYTIDMFGTTPNIYRAYCCIPLLLQLLLSAGELISARLRFGGMSPRPLLGAKNRPASLARLGVLVLAAVLTATACAVTRIPLDERLYREYGYTTDGDYSYYVENGEAVLRGYHGRGGRVTVPEELGGYPVTSLGNGAFSGTEVTEVILHEWITSLPTDLFEDCTALRRVSLPDGLERIGSYAFGGCTSLTEVDFSGEDYIDVSYLAFDGSGISASPEVREQGYLMLGNTVAWVDRASISGAVRIPEGVTAIGDSMFSGATGITELYLPSTLTYIDRSAFSGCTALYYVSLPVGLEKIDTAAFRGCERLYLIDNYSSLELARNDENGGVARYAKVISEDGTALSHRTDDGFVFAEVDGTYTLIAADESCPTLVLPSDYLGCKYKIDSRLLTTDARVYNVVLPDGYTWSSGETEKRHLFRVEYGESTLKCDLGVYYFTDEEGRILTVTGPASDADSLTLSELAALGDYSVVITDYAFYGTELSCVTLDLPCTVKSYAFADCRSLLTLTATESVGIGSNAFAGCTALRQIDISGGELSLGSSAFKDCTSLCGVSISGERLSVGGSAFAYCTALGQVSLSGSEEMTLYSAFFECTALSDVSLSGRVIIVDTPFLGSSAPPRRLDLSAAVEIRRAIISMSEGECEIYLGKGLTTLSRNAFNSLDGSVRIYYGGSVEDWQKISCYEEDGGSLNTEIRLFIDGTEVTDPSLLELSGAES